MDTENKVVELIKQITGSLPNSTMEDLFKMGILDSLAVMKMVGELDDLFEIDIDVDDVIAKNFNTVDHIVNMIEKYKQQGE